MWEELVKLLNDMIEKYEITEEDQKLISDAVTKCYDNEDVEEEVYETDEVTDEERVDEQIRQ